MCSVLSRQYHLFFYYCCNYRYIQQDVLPFWKSIFRVNSKKNWKISEVVSLLSFPLFFSKEHCLNSLLRQREISFCLLAAQTSAAEMPPSKPLANLPSTKTIHCLVPVPAPISSSMTIILKLNCPSFVNALFQSIFIQSENVNLKFSICKDLWEGYRTGAVPQGTLTY